MLKSKLLDMTKRTSLYLFSFMKWILIAVLIGAAGGLVGVAFHVSVEKVTEIREAHSWILYFLPVSGLFIALIYKISGLRDVGTNDVIDSVRSKGKLPFLLPPVIFASTVVTHLSGGSAGREGAALQLGGGIGSIIGKLFSLDSKDMNLAILCGMSALFSALFGTPLTAVFFAIEVISVGILYYSGLIPCLVSSLAAYYISVVFKCAPVRFSLSFVPDYSLKAFFFVALISALSAGASILFCLALHYTEFFGAKLFKSPFLRAFIGGAVIVGLSLLCGRDYNGAGMDIIEKAVEAGSAVPYAFILKLIFTAITIGSGFKGGEIVPTLFIGSTFGCAFASFLDLDPGFGAAIGMIAMFCGVVNCPVASIFLSIEIFGAKGLLFFAAACALSYILSGYFGVYSSQKIMYSKVKAEFININTWRKLYNKSNVSAAPSKEDKND